MPLSSGVYIWNFKMANGTTNNLTSDISKTYQSILINQWKGIKIVNRDNIATILEHRENEIIIGEKIQISDGMKQTLKGYGATIVALGEVKQNPGAGQYTVSIKFVNIFTTQILANPMGVLDENKFENKSSRDQFLATLIPDPLVIHSETEGEDFTKQSLDVLPKQALTVSKEAWKYLQNAYFEDFSNWQGRSDFRKDIWNKKMENGKCNSLIEDGRYMIKIEQDGYVKHKYIQDSLIGEQNNFQDAHPVSVTVHINEQPTCLATNNCLGTGISVRYSKNQNSGYAFLLTDDGDLKFVKFNNIHKPDDIKPLFSKTIKVTRGKDYNLGVIAIDQNFYLYVDQKFEKMVTDDTFSKGLNGVIAIGKGVHWLDNITVYKSIAVGQ